MTTRHESLGAAFVVLAFFVSRGLYRAGGVRFDVSPIPYFAQLLDPTLLRDRLLESVFYLHAQPPLYNLLTGVTLKLAPHSPEWILAPLFALCGLYTALCLFVILLRLRVPAIVAALTAGSIVASPAFVLYENWYFYPHLNVTWLVGAVAWLAISRARPGGAMLLAATHLATLSLTRSLFHPLFYALASLLVVVVTRSALRRRALICFLIPGSLVFALGLKNQLLFGFFGTSSWTSRNFSHAVVAVLGPRRVEAEDRLGHLSPAIRTTGFERGDRNIAVFGLHLRPTGVPALDEVTKKTPSINNTNFNHHSYPPSAHFYASDAGQLIRTYPLAYLRELGRQSVRAFLRPVDSGEYLQKNREAIPGPVRWFDALDASNFTRCLLALGLTLALASSLLERASRARIVVVGLVFLAVAWVSVAGVVGEFGENYRFRYKILWLAWITAVAGYTWAIRRARARVRRRRPA